MGIFSAYHACGQNHLSVVLKDKSTDEPLMGATAILEGTTTGASADSDGKLTIRNIPDGNHVIVFSFVGYETIRRSFTFPIKADQPLKIYLSGGKELENIYISATRSTRSIDDIPTRMEVITGEDLNENAVMNSANISQLLRESSGIMVQQTSLSSGNQELRIQGLDGRYTQLLKDGFPLYGGFSGGLSLMQVPPLDLHQVEVIKGSASTLYGGGAIAGLINLVSKQPVVGNPEMNLMLNQTSAKGTTANLFISRKFRKTGLTFYASGNNQRPYDPDDDGFSDIPEVRNLNINPKFFWYPSGKSKFWFGINTSFENRTGGDMRSILGHDDSLHTFSEINISKRISSELYYDYEAGNGSQVTFRNSINYFNRIIDLPSYSFSGSQFASFSELTWAIENHKNAWIAGANLFTDNFMDNSVNDARYSRSYEYTTIGTFIQNSLHFSNKVILESGFRTDYNLDYGVFPLPRISLLIKPDPKFSSRLGAGMGYKLPSIFDDEAESRAFQNVDPVNADTVSSERSSGVSFDLNYMISSGKNLTFSVNQLFFYTRLTSSIMLKPVNGTSRYIYFNADGPVISKGFETNIKGSLKDFELYLQYSYVDVKLLYKNINQQKPLTPKHNVGASLIYESEGKWRIGYEIYYTGSQFRDDYTRTPDYWMMGFMALRELGHFSAFINFENFTDTRQSHFQKMVYPPYTDPSFAEIWAPADGIITSIGLMYRFYRNDPGLNIK